jgi:hypothetical protein
MLAKYLQADDNSLQHFSKFFKHDYPLICHYIVHTYNEIAYNIAHNTMKIFVMFHKALCVTDYIMKYIKFLIKSPNSKDIPSEKDSPHN